MVQVLDAFYKYTSAPTAIRVLQTQSLRWSSPLRFNDPFDVTQTLRLDFEPAVLAPLIVAETARVLESPKAPSQGSDFRLRLLHAMLWQTSSAVSRAKVLAEFRRQHYELPPMAEAAFHLLQQVWAQTVQQFRILCLSQFPDITPMWHHYAESYTGAVLELVPDQSVDSALQLARPVVYQDTPPRIASPEVWARTLVDTNGTGFHDLFRETQYAKTLAWEYEREWRVVSLARAGDTGLFADLPFHPLELKGVYLGPSASSETEAALLSLLANELAHVSLYRAQVPAAPGTAFTFVRRK